MSALDDIEQLLSGMSRAEKAQVLQWVVRDLGDAFPGIESHPDITGGEPYIARTRIHVWVLVQARSLARASPTSYATTRHSMLRIWSTPGAMRVPIAKRGTSLGEPKLVGDPGIWRSH